jgi:UDP-N-acetylmuramoyl-tripeptide--D-alanyl-D-alanine ligase
VPNFNPEQLAAWTGGRWTRPPAGPLTGFHFDSRQMRPGLVFVAIKTAARDGHAFLAAAAQAGAAAALVATPDARVDLPQLVVGDPLGAWQAIAREHRRAFAGPVVGISGSAGKTSTKDLLALLLGGASCGVVATEGNFNNHLGVPLTLTRIDPAEHRFAVVEAGINAPGEMTPLAAMIQPDVAIVTLVAPAHTEALGGIDGVAREKSRLPAATRVGGVAIFSRATAEQAAFRDLAVRRMIVERAEVVRPAEPPKDRVFFAITHRGEETAVALAYGPPPPLNFTFRRVSDGMAQNAVLAICAALWLGVARESIQARLREWRPAAMRGEIRHVDGRLLYLDCYNANPASMADALAAFAGIAPEAAPRLYVLGGMEELGAHAADYHRELGRTLALRPGDQVYLIGPHAAVVAEALRARGHAAPAVQVMETLAPAAAALAEWPGAIFVKGSRRYALEQVLAGAAGEVLAHA